MMKQKQRKLFLRLRRDSDFLKSMNYIVTSDYDQRYLKPEHVKKINFLKWFYLAFIICAITISFVPLVAGDFVTKNKTTLLTLNIIMFAIFLSDYCFRWITYSCRANEDSKFPLLFFPFTGVSLIMLFAILPSFIILFFPLIESLGTNAALEDFVNTLSSLVILQLGRLLLLLNVVPPFRIFTNIFIKQKKILTYVFVFLILVTFLFAIVIYRAEVNQNANIHNYWDAFYFTVISICTIGYGDIIPMTTLGRAMVIVLAFVGVAIFTIPAAVIAGGFMEEIQDQRAWAKHKAKSEKEEHEKSISIAEKTVLKSISSVKKVVKKVPKKTKKPNSENDDKNTKHKKR